MPINARITHWAANRALLRAAERSDASGAVEALKRGADPEAIGADNMTPMDYAHLNMDGNMYSIIREARMTKRGLSAEQYTRLEMEEFSRALSSALDWTRP